MQRLIVLIVLCAQMVSLWASPLFDARRKVWLGDTADGQLPLRELPSDAVSIVMYSPTPLTEFSRYLRKYAATDFVNHKESASIATDSPTIIVLNGNEASQVADASRLANRLNHLLGVVWFNPPADAALPFEVDILFAADASAHTQAAAAQALMGGCDVRCHNGQIIAKTRLGYAESTDVGIDGGLAKRIDSIVAANIKAHSFPGCQVLVARHGEIVIDKPYGRQGYATDALPITDTTLYDVASMTKVMATTPAIMHEIDARTLSLSTRPADILPRLRRDGVEDLTVADFLYHHTGFPATINTYKLLLDTASYSGRLITSKRKAPNTIKIDKNTYINVDARFYNGLFSNKRNDQFHIPVGKNTYASDRVTALVDSAIYNAPLKVRKYLYSCLNFCILKDLAESVSGSQFDELVRANVFAPLGMHYTCFRPLGRFPRSQIAPTENEPFMRRQLLQGHVHDEISAYSGGVQGNAGLFMTAADVAKLCQTWLQGGSYGGVTIFNPATVERFTTAEDTQSQRLPGFDTAHRTRSWRATGLSDKAYGHTGFTGTCCWIDPDYDLIFVFLCNRVNPSRDNSAFTAHNPRGTILTTIIESIINDKKDSKTEE